MYREAGLLPLNRNPDSENERITTFNTAKQFGLLSLTSQPTDTCPGERRDGAEGKGSAQPPRQRGGGRLTLPRTLMVTDELGQVGRWGGDE